MTAEALVYTAGLLALYLVFGGAYGTLYALARRPGRRWFSAGAATAFLVQLVVLGAILVLTPLALPWKLLLALMTLGFLAAPPAVWRLLDRMHSTNMRSN